MPSIEIRAQRTGATVTLHLTGRLDALSAETLAAAIPAGLDLRRLVLDMAECPYLSSGGIRVILAQHKRLAPLGGGLELVNVQPDVRRVLDLTGLAELLSIRDKAREISTEGLEYLAEGVFGEVFRMDEETVVKLYREGVDPAVVEKEKRFARAAFIAGIPTPISFDVVTSGNRLGIAYELLRAESLAARMRRDPDHLDDHARLLAQLARTIHATSADPTVFPDIKEEAAGWIADLAPELGESDLAVLRAKLGAIPDAGTCVHFDLHAGNVMIQDGEPVVIDMGDFSRGSGLFDLGLLETIYSPLIGLCERVTGSSNTIGADFLARFLDHYFDGLPAADRARFEQDRPFFGSLRLLHSIRLLDALPDLRAELLVTLRERLLPQMRA
jgi:uncharacterized protein (TIGR02172 family)